MRRFYLLPVVIALAVCFPLTAGAFTVSLDGNSTTLVRDPLVDPIPESLKLVSNELSFDGAPDVGDEPFPYSSAGWITGYALSSSGDLIASSSWKSTPFVYIGVGSYFKATVSSSGPYICFYDDEYRFISRVSLTGTVILNDSKIPNGARYARWYDSRWSRTLTITCTDVVRDSFVLNNVSFDNNPSVTSYQIPTDVVDTQLVVKWAGGSQVFAVPGTDSRTPIVPPTDIILQKVSIASVETTVPVSFADNAWKPLEDPIIVNTIYALVLVLGLLFVRLIRKPRR